MYIRVAALICIIFIGYIRNEIRAAQFGFCILGLALSNDVESTNLHFHFVQSNAVCVCVTGGECFVVAITIKTE